MQTEVFAVRYGTRSTTKAHVYLNHWVYGEDDSPVDMDYYFWVIRRGDRCILVDTGFSPYGGKSRGRTMLADPVDLLGELDLSPAAVDAVVVSHAHYDHIGNLTALSGEGEVVVAANELDFWTSPMGRRTQFATSAEVDEIEALRTSKRLITVRGQGDVSPGVSYLEVGGHTPGQLVVLVQTDDGPVLLASDAVHYYEELEADRPFHSVADLPAMYRAFDRINELASDPRLAVVAGHDPLVRERFAPMAAHSDIIRIR